MATNQHFDNRGLKDFHSVNASEVMVDYQHHVIRIVATVTSSVSLAAAVCACYWFYMMPRNFRRDLVLLLILGGSWKSLWFLIFSVVVFAQGSVPTESIFCQASGYMLQVGFELCDLAVLSMSIHLYLQIFPPKDTLLGGDGLYRLRYWVIATWFILPNVSGALAFINPRSAFENEGGFCFLPLRPYWYRLALFWIPRYLIWAYVIYVSLTIYRFVGSEFKVFAHENDESSRIPGESSSGRQGSNATRRASLPTCSTGGNATVSEPLPFGSPSKSNSPSRRDSRQKSNDMTAEDATAPPNVDSAGFRGSVASFLSAHSSNAPREGTDGLPPIQEGAPTAGKNTPEATTSATHAVKVRRRAIQRQLRLLFIYPCVYMLCWVIPFVVNIMNYADYFAQHPLFPLRVISLSCMTTMTFVDVSIFCWRERPWKHIPGSDGTILGSFMWWRFCFAEAWVRDRRASRAESRAGLLKRWGSKWSKPDVEVTTVQSPRPRAPHRHTHSGGSDRRFMENERARERLAMERAESDQLRRSLQEKRRSGASEQRRDWFDLQMEGDLFVDLDHGAAAGDGKQVD